MNIVGKSVETACNNDTERISKINFQRSGAAACDYVGVQINSRDKGARRPPLRARLPPSDERVKYRAPRARHRRIPIPAAVCAPGHPLIGG